MIQVKKLRENTIMPTKGSPESAGYDLYAALDKDEVIFPNETKMIPTGIAIALPNNIFGAIFARSGLATKQGLRPANCVGVCDPDYRGEYCVALYNDSEVSRIVHPGDRVAQLVFLLFASTELTEVEELDETERGKSGFGSTGV